MGSDRKKVIHRPITLLYFFILLLLLIFSTSFIVIFSLFIAIGVPLEAFSAILLLSLFGSYVNIPLTVIESKEPRRTFKEIRFFGITWRIPALQTELKKTVVAINLGGAVVPILISIYLLLWSIPKCSSNLYMTYFKVLLVLVVVTLGTCKSSRVIKGLGIATLVFGPPIITALSTIFVDWINPTFCPTQIAYVGGTLGTLIGADLLNLNKLSELAAPIVSIGGAGTFDGIYITGLASVMMVLLIG